LQGNLEGKRVGFHNCSTDDFVFRDELVFAAQDDRSRKTWQYHALRHGYYSITVLKSVKIITKEAN
jgi:hypothetical protein